MFITDVQGLFSHSESECALHRRNAQNEPNTLVSRRAEVPTALVLEDDLTNQRVFCAVMEREGYSVLAASDPHEALAQSRAYKGPIALLVADVILREDDGAKSADQLLRERPRMAVLFVSGTPLELLKQRAAIERAICHYGNVQYLQKPFSVRALLETVRYLTHNRARTADQYDA